MSFYGVSINIQALIRLLSLRIASCLHIIGKWLATCKYTMVPSVLIFSSFFSARHFATEDITHAVADSAFGRSKICLSVGSLDTIVMVDNTGQNNSISGNLN